MALAMVLSMGVRAQSAAEDVVIDPLNYSAFSAQVIDADNNRTLPFATVEAVGSNTATVTNIDGEFIIKLPRGTSVSSLKISYIGYSNKIVALGEFREGRTLTVLLEPSSIRLQEITIRPEDALNLIMDALSYIKDNYSEEPMMMRGFYRETIERGRNYVSISEAVVDIFKGSYTNVFQAD